MKVPKMAKFSRRLYTIPKSVEAAWVKLLYELNILPSDSQRLFCVLVFIEQLKEGEWNISRSRPRRRKR